MRKLRVIKHRPQITIFTAVACIAILSVASGCGGGKDTSETVRAAAISLQQAMNEASRNIDEARGTRSSLDKLSSVLKPSIAQTGDVIVTLTPKAGSEGAEAELLKAAQEQRTFLQYSADAAGATSWKVGKGNLARAKEASRRAVDTHAQIAQDKRLSRSSWNLVATVR